MKKLKVAVLSGGVSNERDISLISGKQVAKNLNRKKYRVIPIEVPQKIEAFFSKQILSKLKNADVAFVAMHGKFGEDGRIQAILETLNVPFTGSGILASSLAMDKFRTNAAAKSVGLFVPNSVLVFKSDMRTFTDVSKRVKTECGFPCFVKPNQSGSSVGAGIAKSEAELEKRLRDGFKHDTEVIVQQFIKGRELTCAVIGNTGSEVLALPPVEIQAKSEFFDRKTKYDSKTIELCPAPLSKKETKEIQRLAVLIHQTLGCDGVTRSDFLLDGEIFYFLETNTIPGLTETSLAPKEARAHGMTFPQYLDLQIKLALKKKY